jgi:hypothetical protein
MTEEKKPVDRRSKRGRKGGRRKSKTDPKAIESAEMRAQVLELRKQGYGYQAIGDAMGFTKQRAYQIVTEELAAIIREPAQQILDLELQRMETLLQGVADDAAKGDPRAIDSELSIRARRARLLGIETPQKQQLDLTSGGAPLPAATGAPTVIQIVAVPATARSDGDSQEKGAAATAVGTDPERAPGQAS